MRKAMTKTVRTRRLTRNPEDGLLNKTWAGIARREEAVLNAATEVVTTMLPLPLRRNTRAAEDLRRPVP